MKTFPNNEVKTQPKGISCSEVLFPFWKFVAFI